MSMILEVKDLCKQFPKSEFKLDNVSFSIPKGSIMGFVGENGCGKTTTMNCILGTIIKDSGSVRIFGEEMTDAATHIRDDIGVVFDSFPVPVKSTPRKLANAMRCIFKNWDDQLFNEYLERFKLKPDTGNFSRGMSMKLALAIALSHHPKLLIFDEATSGLDPVIRDEVLDIFLEFVSNGENSILLSSHITSDLEKVADYIMFMQEGKVVFTEEKDVLKYGYGIMRLTAAQFDALDPREMLTYRRRDYQTDVLVKNRTAMVAKYPDTVVDLATIEEIMLLLVKGESL
ncbi:MAG: ABC transporter ATP-binding protein [Oscillospiraceae bacterium]|nr:ABC transporter ATP-binding protein [Oscillospiraceae bacterium]